LLALDSKGALELDVSGEVWPTRQAEPGGDRERERCRQRDQLRQPEDERGDQPEARKADVRGQLRLGPACEGGDVHGLAVGSRATPKSSAAGVGTVSSACRTTSSGLTRWTQSSGRSIRRWPSARPATALTSSGVT